MGVGKEKEEKNTCTPIQYQNAPVSPQTTQADGINKMCSQSRSLITGRSCGVEGNGGLDGKFEVVRERKSMWGASNLGLLEICFLKCSLSLDRCYLLVFKDKLFSLTCPGDSCSRDRWP